MIRIPGHPLLRHGAVLALLLLSLGVTQVVHVEPRRAETRLLRAEGRELAAELADLQLGIQDLESWRASHPGQAPGAFRGRRALPARDAAAAFLCAIVPIAERNRVRTERIATPSGPNSGEDPVVVAQSGGAPASFRRLELRFHVIARYQDLGAYLEQVESLDQYAVVRSVSVRRGGDGLVQADVIFWIFGSV